MGRLSPLSPSSSKNPETPKTLISCPPIQLMGLSLSHAALTLKMLLPLLLLLALLPSATASAASTAAACRPQGARWPKGVESPPLPPPRRGARVVPAGLGT